MVFPWSVACDDTKKINNEIREETSSANPQLLLCSFLLLQPLLSNFGKLYLAGAMGKRLGHQTLLETET